MKQAEMKDQPESTPGVVLVVEDDRRARETIRDILTAQGYRVLEAENGPTALELLQHEGPDVVLLDVVMPGMDGFEVCRRIKQDERLAMIPVILLTALTERRYVVQGIGAGADEFVSKPIDMDEFLLRMRNAVRMHRLYRQLDEQYERLKRAEEWREQLLRMLAHDLKVPLAGVLGNLELLIEECRGTVEEEAMACLMDAHEATLRALKMAEAVVDIGRLEEGRFPLKYSTCRLNELTQAAVDELRPMADERGITVTVEGTPVTVRCDPGVVMRVIENLLDNAIAYAPARSRVKIRISEEDDRARVEVQDEGPGVPPELREKIFEKFAQVEAYARGRRYSKGLGLTFCKLAVEAHGGAIGVESTPGKGSTFWFTLPRKASQPEEANGPAGQ